jgi:hypothetical protein
LNGKTGTISGFIPGNFYAKSARARSADWNASMDDDHSSDVFDFVEHAFIRMQAGEVLTQCLDDGKLAPLQSLVETLIVAGSQSLDYLREILEEVYRRKSQITNDQHQVFVKLESELGNYAIHLGGLHSVMSLVRLTPMGFLEFLRSQKIEDEAVQMVCMQRLDEALSLLRSLNGHLHLLEDIEMYLDDWMWGLIYLAAQDEWQGLMPSRNSRQRML